MSLRHLKSKKADPLWYVQWDQSSPGNSASRYSDQSIIKLDFLAA